MKDYNNYLSEKPFSCDRFDSEDHLSVHKKRHDMLLTLGLGSKTATFVDQTPTPTQFIKNCEEVGLFQDLQNVNPFEETFKKAVEAVQSGQPICLDKTPDTNPIDDTLHTPNVFPHINDVPSVHHRNECLKHSNTPLVEDVFIKQENIKIVDVNEAVSDKDAGSKPTEERQTCAIPFKNLVKSEIPSLTENQALMNAPEGPCQIVQFVTPEISQAHCNMVVIKNSDNLYSALELDVRDKLKKNLRERKNSKIIQPKVPISKCPTKKTTNSLSSKFSNFSKNSLKMISKLENPESEMYDSNPVPKKKKKNEKFPTKESRNEYLARSRAASFRCREKKKMYILYLEKVNIELSTANQNLQLVNFSLRKQIRELHAELSKHRSCNLADKSMEAALTTAANAIKNKTISEEEKTPKSFQHFSNQNFNLKSSEISQAPTVNLSSPCEETTEIGEQMQDPHFFTLDVAEVTLNDQTEETEIPLKECNKSSDIIVRFNSAGNDLPVQFVPDSSFLTSYMAGAGDNVRRIYNEHCYFLKRGFFNVGKESLSELLAADSSLSPTDNSITFEMDLKGRGSFRDLTGLKKLQVDTKTPPPLILLKPFKKRTLQKKKTEKT
ncbi:hypothetical protein RUM44_013526 [Polyplax serrata]|uniref:BZIP domain-containing protein n=1 Tax=Polyplax serrata TaxID=468196 RepID=A0ABR1BGB5_POLSC